MRKKRQANRQIDRKTKHNEAFRNLANALKTKNIAILALLIKKKNSPSEFK
jgi:hypothetical protein